MKFRFHVLAQNSKAYIYFDTNFDTYLFGTENKSEMV